MAGSDIGLAGKWVLFQHFESKRPGRYFATAKVVKIVPESVSSGMYLALMESGSFRSYPVPVPFDDHDQRPRERALFFPGGRINSAPAAEPVRPISEEEYHRIDNLGQAQDDRNYVQPAVEPD